MFSVGNFFPYLLLILCTFTVSLAQDWKVAATSAVSLYLPCRIVTLLCPIFYTNFLSTQSFQACLGLYSKIILVATILYTSLSYM